MYGWSIATGSVLLCVVLALPLGCGGRVDENDQSGSVGGAAGASAAGSGGGGGGSFSAGRSGSAGRAGSAGTSVVEPGCPDVEPPPPRIECDPLAPSASCAAGQACYPFVDHPFGKGCDAVTYGAVCVQAGSGQQGALCGNGTDGCAAGHLCVVGASSGRRCARLCTFTAGQCPAGMICLDTDVSGYGVCG